MSFIVLHYTACSLKETLKIFLDPKSKVSAHFVIDVDGKIYNCVEINKSAWHSGQSCFSDTQNKDLKNFNDFSIGIELVNLNGNLFNYSEHQYDSLFYLVKYLQTKYPLLKDPNKILGHEHIAGFRGKADPGYFFDWKKLFAICYENQTPPIRKPIISSEILKKYQSQLKQKDINFKALNQSLEKTLNQNYNKSKVG
ncbi:MAG: N-acetylmuramoyl-L-alanine amidase [Bdellovibrionales bacterium]|nr:N-acetylmuramoyl-L-alanine amidase [Bdellovibrionales bacterium]